MNRSRYWQPERLLSGAEYDILEAKAFGKIIYETAFLVQSGVTLSFVKRYSEEIRGARTHEELAEVLARAAERAPIFTGTSLGGFSDRTEAQKRARIEAREHGLSQEEQRRQGCGLPSLYNRWTDSWEGRATWRHVPFVDHPTGPVYHTTIEGCP
jgi:GTP cyclohydrolase III